MQSGIQQGEQSFYQKIGLKFKGDTSRIII
jgi:hypothetical protein